MNLDSGWAAIIAMIGIATIGGIGKLLQMVHRIENEISGTAATLKDHGRRLDSLEGEVRNILQIVLREWRGNSQ